MDTASASSQPQQPSSATQPSSTGPQIRSRITVVCAECKRLKLKCDRRGPCGSCTKRGTVVRCIYSPAAAEKVDLHSLNNRLIQVEATLALVTSGQNPPAFQSTYPLSRPSNASCSSQSQDSHQHHHHYAAPTLRDTCISLSHQDLSLWLEELDLGISLPSSSSGASSSMVGSSGYIKLEPSPFEIELTHPRSTTDNPIAIDTDDSQTLSGDSTKSISALPTSPPLKHNAHPFHQQLQSQSRLQKQQRYSAQMSLPALSIYYPVPSITLLGTSPLSVSVFPHRPTSPSSKKRASASPASPPSPSSYTFPTHSQSPQYSKPQITPALIALLPSLPTCKRFLNSAKEIFRVRPVPFEPKDGWIGFEKRCISLLGGSNLGKKERVRDNAKEKEEKAKRARQIYFAGIPDLQSVQQRIDNLDDSGGGTSDSSFGGGGMVDDGGDMGGENFSLPFFAVTCAVLAVGSHPSSNQGSVPSENPAFFFALSQQALGVWDTHTSSSGNAEERERMDFLLASLIGMVYLIFSGSSVSAVGEDENQEGLNLAYPLVGKIVNAARGMGLGKDGPGRQSKTSDRDASVSPSRARSRYQTNKEKGTEKERLLEDWKLLMWWDIMFYDLFIADSLGHEPYMSSYPYTTKLPECASDRSMPAMPADPDNDGYDSDDEELEHPYGHDGMTIQQDDLDKSRYQPTVNSGINGVTERDEEAYVAARCRLTQLAQTIKHRMAHPECCCGYTIDQAAFLESEIRRWQLGMAPSIKLMSVSSGEDTRHPPLHCGSDLGGQQDKPPASLVSQMQSYELALIANLLTLRVHAPFLHAPSPAPPTPLSHPKTPSSASQLNALAAQSTVQAAQSIIRTAKSFHAVLASSPSPSPIPPSLLDFYPLEKMVLDSVIICVNPALNTKPFPSSSTWTFDTNALVEDVVSGLNLLSELREMAEPYRKFVDALYKKLSQRGTNFLKRKHDQVDMTLEGSSPSTTTTNGIDNGNSVTQQEQSKAIDLSSAFSSPMSSLAGSLEQQHVRKHKNNDNEDLISAITSAASARLAAAAAERDNEKGKDKSPKHAKKSYPSVGIRVRVAKDGSIIRPQRAQATTTGSGGQMQPPCPNADAVLAFQQQQSFGSAHMYNTQSQPLYEQSQSSFDPITGSSLFGPPQPTSTTSPVTYYRGTSSFTPFATNSPTLHSSNLSTLQEHGNGSGMPLMDMGMDSTMMPSTILETPIYDKTIYDKSQQQQHAMYDPKPSIVDNMARQQQHFQQHSTFDAGSQNHRHMVPVIPPWSSPTLPQQQQSSMSSQNDQSFWNNDGGFKFYS